MPAMTVVLYDVQLGSSPWHAWSRGYTRPRSRTATVVQGVHTFSSSWQPPNSAPARTDTVHLRMFEICLVCRATANGEGRPGGQHLFPFSSDAARSLRGLARLVLPVLAKGPSAPISTNKGAFRVCVVMDRGLQCESISR